MIAAAAPGPDICSEPPATLCWQPLDRPCTVAEAQRAGRAPPSPQAIDALDWYFRCSFTQADTAGVPFLCFEGLAGLAEVWLNGFKILTSDNMFIASEVAVGAILATDNDLVLRFRSIETELAKRRPRPAWRTPMVGHQQLRWLRMTLLGRTPGWSPPVPPVGPWRPIRLEHRRGVSFEHAGLSSRIDKDGGLIEVRCLLTPLEDRAVRDAAVIVSGGGREFRAPLQASGSAQECLAHVSLPMVERWWPHTHGAQPLYDVRVEVAVDGGPPLVADLGPTGFKQIELEREAGGFALMINGERLFCRGASWMPLDVVSLASGEPELRAAMDQVRRAGMNMLRISGAAVYEDNSFLDACDRQGVLIWQDFMFASMDYPADDVAFDASVRREAAQQLQRLSGHPALAVLCGNSEVEQQAAMAGAPRERWRPALFHESLAELSRRLCPAIPYTPSSAHGGAFPHRNDEGTTSYYGVGAYLRPMTDVRTSHVRFATECLAFANVPEPATLRLMPGGPGLTVHRPEWKERVPRDRGAGWDFDDVRDHYLGQIFAVNPLELRYADHERYLELSRLVSAEVMQSAFRYWRRPDSGCAGALMWFLRDLWPGAGWGIVGSDGIPKAAFYVVRRALQPVAVALSDEGCNGVDVHVWNDWPHTLDARLELALFRHGEIPVARASKPVQLAGGACLSLPACEFFDTLLDLNHAYRFGPPGHDLLCAALRDEAGQLLAEHHLMLFPARMIEPVDIGLEARARTLPDGTAELLIGARRFAYAVAIHADNFVPDDQYLNVPPGETRCVRITPTIPGSKLKGTVRAINSRSAARIQGQT